ncbi:hypothetical protein PENSPDRAFT_620180 [Peniophora sp. CONT]|nr:hypothetical protein PENSPDRAFT_620180 [Peniophora sp. CONT]
MFRSTLLLLVCPLLVRAQYGFGPVTSSGEDGNSTSTQPLLEDQSADLRAAGFILEYSLIGIVVETLLFGIFLTLYAFSTKILLHKGMHNASYRGMLAVTTAMAIASTSYWGVSLAIVIKNLRDILVNHPTSPLSDRFDMANVNVLKLYAAEVYLPMVNYWLSDAVVVWRAWTLWPQRKWLVFPFPIFCLFASFVTNLVVGGMKVRAMHNDSDAWEYAMSYLQIASWSLSLGTNFFATLAIAWKAWVFRRNISDNLGESSSRMRVEKVLAMLVETGALYLVTQLAVVVSWFVLLPGTVSAWSSDLFGEAAAMLAAIYPTIIIVLVSLDNVVLDLVRTRVSAPPSSSGRSGPNDTHMSFAGNPSETLSAYGNGSQEEKSRFAPLSVGVLSSMHLSASNVGSSSEVGHSKGEVGYESPPASSTVQDFERQ